MYQNQPFEGELAVCLICGEKFLKIERHLKREHSLTAFEYRRMNNLFPNKSLSNPRIEQAEVEGGKKSKANRNFNLYDKEK